MSNIKKTTIRFNMDNPIHREAWSYLQSIDKNKFKSCSSAIMTAIIEYFDRYYKQQSDPYLETREREERFVEQIVSSVEKSLLQNLPGILSNITTIDKITYPMKSETEETTEADIDWDFVGNG